MDASSKLEQIHQRPTPAEWRAFAVLMLHAAGLGALGAGVIFFVAANWQAWGLVGRFALLQAGLLICIAVALVQPPPLRVGQGGLLLATLFAGGLLALFGQSYQTGADAYELFFTWALLTLPFAGAALSGAAWAVWWSVLNVGLVLLCGVLGLDHFSWRVIDNWGWDRAAVLMMPCLVNLLGAELFLLLRRTWLVDAAPLWLLRFLLTLGLAYGTAASLPNVTDHGTTVWALYAAISVGIGVATWARRQEVFPLTVLAGSWITISTAWLTHSMRLNGLGEVFIVAMWLVASSAVTGMFLMRWSRQLHTAGADGARS